MKKFIIPFIVLSVLISPIIVLANGDDSEHHYGMMNMGAGWSWFGWVWMILVLIAVIVGIIALVKYIIK